MIVIDASPVVHRKAGLGRYTEELIGALLAQSSEPGAYAAFYHNALDAQPGKLIQSMHCYISEQSPYVWRLRALIAQLLNVAQDALFSHLRTNTHDQLPAPRLFHATEHLLPRFKRIKTVFTLHDVIFRVYPQHHLPMNRIYLTLAMPLFLRRADAVICVSEHTRRDALSYYRLPPDKLRVIPEGVHPRFRRVHDTLELARVRARYRLAERFLLVVSTIEPRKNLPTLFAAFRALHEHNLVDELVVVGKQGWLHEPIYRAVHEMGLTGLVRFLGFVEDEDLPALYSLAQAFAFPSLYEGFGLPTLEALACGTPVVASNAAAIPEVVGDAGLLLPPQEVSEWVTALECVCTDAALRREMQQRGPRRAAQFTWERAAQATRLVYDTLLATS
ncbi:MAG: glycosyltransferase family 4 protein [Thermoflexales bacterium]